MQRFLLFVMISITGCNSVDTVYLCNGPYSKAYHRTSHCKGLKYCTTDIESTDIGTAKEKNRRACRYCYH